VPIVLESGSLNLLKTYGSVKVCNGIALPLPRVIYLAATRQNGGMDKWKSKLQELFLCSDKYIYISPIVLSDTEFQRFHPKVYSNI
jgi:hypothetical protein